MPLRRLRAAFGPSAVALSDPRPPTGTPPAAEAGVPRRNDIPEPPAVFGLCADDYAFSRGVGSAIRALIEAGRISATSCLVTSPLWPEEAERLRACSPSAEIGLHLNLTLGAPLGPLPRLAPAGRLPPLEWLIFLSLTAGIDRFEVEAEIDRQLDRFVDAFGRLPDFVDGHEHVQQFPIVRDAVFSVFARRLRDTQTWLRYPAMSSRDVWRHRTALVGASCIRLLGFGFEQRGREQGIPGNTAFRGVRRFRDEPPYAALFARFLDDLPAGALVMCHPGIADPASPLTRHPGVARVEEFRFLLSDAFLALLRERRLRLGPLRRPAATPVGTSADA